MIYPWQTSQWQHFLAAKNSQHLAHALLLSGMEGCGKKVFANVVAQSLLCEQADQQGMPCSHCKSCNVFNSEAHPDYRSVSLQDDKQDISIQQIRDLTQFLELSCSFGQSKVVIINDADRMNNSAANSLLKTLEEPSPNTVIILVTSQVSSLLPTIRSRCQQIIFTIPNKTDAITWLASQSLIHSPEGLLSIAGGRPLLAKELDNSDLLKKRKYLAQALISLLNGQSNYIELAKHWEKENFTTLLSWQLSWTQDLLNHAILNQAVDKNYRALDINKELKQLNLLLNVSKLWKLYDSLLSLIKLANHPVNKILFVEKMLLIWLEAKSK